MRCRQMNFRREKANNLYLRDTQVENIFLTEYMPGAEGDFVKSLPDGAHVRRG